MLPSVWTDRADECFRATEHRFRSGASKTSGRLDVKIFGAHVAACDPLADSALRPPAQARGAGALERRGHAGGAAPRWLMPRPAVAPVRLRSHRLHRRHGSTVDALPRRTTAEQPPHRSTAVTNLPEPAVVAGVVAVEDRGCGRRTTTSLRPSPVRTGAGTRPGPVPRAGRGRCRTAWPLLLEPDAARTLTAARRRSPAPTAGRPRPGLLQDERRLTQALPTGPAGAAQVVVAQAGRDPGRTSGTARCQDSTQS